MCDVKNLQIDVADEIEEAICELKSSTKKTVTLPPSHQQSSSQVTITNRGFIRARNISGSGSQGLLHHHSLGVT